MFLVYGSKITVYENGTPAAVADSGIVQKGGQWNASTPLFWGSPELLIHP